MIILKYIALILLGLGLGYIITSKTAKVIDNTEYYREENAKLLKKNERQAELISKQNQTISQSEQRFDSLIEYQNKMYIYYESKKDNIINDMADSAVYVNFVNEFR